MWFEIPKPGTNLSYINRQSLDNNKQKFDNLGLDSILKSPHYRHNATQWHEYDPMHLRRTFDVTSFDCEMVFAILDRV